MSEIAALWDEVQASRLLTTGIDRKPHSSPGLTTMEKEFC